MNNIKRGRYYKKPEISSNHFKASLIVSCPHVRMHIHPLVRVGGVHLEGGSSADQNHGTALPYSLFRRRLEGEKKIVSLNYAENFTFNQ